MAWIWFAFGAAFCCVPRIAWIVLEFDTLNTSSDGMNRTFRA